MNRFPASASFYKKAAIVDCLFLFLTLQAFSTFGQEDWMLDGRSRQAYDLMMDLQTAAAISTLGGHETAEQKYLVSTARALELLITEDPGSFSAYEDHFEKLTAAKPEADDPKGQFLVAEAHLQWALIYLKFGHELDAALHLRQAYQMTETLRESAPDFVPIQKTYGLLQVAIGAVPEKYGWVLALFGMEGSIDAGLSALRDERLLKSDLGVESRLLYALIQGFILQRPDSAYRAVLKIQPQNRLIRYTGAVLAMKCGKSEEALNLLTTITGGTGALPVYHADYLLGEIHLHKANYPAAIGHYRNFIDKYPGQNHLKDAWFKTGLCYWLNGQDSRAETCFEEAKHTGRELSEADRSAARALAREAFPNVLLSKARYATDGGYFSDAERILASVRDRDLATKKEEVEYYYRKARLAHLTQQVGPAKLFYRQTIGMALDEPDYFAPNACLQMGYISLSEGDVNEARIWFSRALTYKKHEYKNSIDSKARTALNRLDQALSAPR